MPKTRKGNPFTAEFCSELMVTQHAIVRWCERSTAKIGGTWEIVDKLREIARRGKECRPIPDRVKKMNYRHGADAVYLYFGDWLLVIKGRNIVTVFDYKPYNWEKPGR